MKKKIKQKFSGTIVKSQAKKVNPFEIHTNRRKYDVLGMKSKAERGLPGISRTRSLQKRKGTLLQEYKLKDKKNVFWDKRIGERNSAMTAEDKIIARYTAERMKFHSKKSIYNLGDDEELTHRGQTLTEIERFDDPKSDDDNDDDEEDDGKLGSHFVEGAHFGGGIFKKVEEEPKSRKDLIDQLISESIKRKAEKQKLKQDTLDMTEKLDSDWKELLPLVTAAKKTKLDPEPENKKDDKFANYDVLSKKLKFEARGKPSDRLKSEEEIAKEEKEKLEELERERLERMLGGTVKKKVTHRSADDMDDGFVLGDEPNAILAYSNGTLNSMNQADSDGEEGDGTLVGNGDGKTSDNEESDNENSSDGDEEEEEEGDEDANNDEAEGEEEGEDDEDEEEDNYSDLKESDESDTEVPEKCTKVSEDNKAKVKKLPDGQKEAKTKSNGKSTTNESEERDTTAEMEAARKQLPFTFKIPKDYDEFEKLMKDYNSDYQSVIVERMIKCHHPSLNPDHKQDLDLLFTFLLQHLQDVASDNATRTSCFRTLDKLSPWLFDLAQWNPQSSTTGVIEVIKEKYKDFCKNPKSYPALDTLIFLKLVSILFPTSDFRHPVVTPAMIFMQEILFKSSLESSVDVSCGLFVTTLLLEYCSMSKRFVPEALNFLHCVLRLAHPKDSTAAVRLPLKLSTMNAFNLNVTGKTGNSVSKLSTADLVEENSSEEFKLNAVSLALDLLSRFCDFWEGGSFGGAVLIFEPFTELLQGGHGFGDCLKEKVDEVLGKILKFKNESLQMLVLEKKRPKPLRLYEPNIEEVYSFKKRPPMGKKKAERAKLMHKYKREMKGALREIRRDRSFLCKLKYKETVRSDMERHRKVNEILNSAAEQQGDLRRIKRNKK